MNLHQGLRNGLEGTSLTGSGIDDCMDVLRRVLAGKEPGKEHVDAGEIIDEDKVAALLAIGIATGALEHLDDAGLLELFGEVVQYAGHAALVLLARAIDIEITQTNDGALHLGHEAPYVIVEDKLGVAVNVQRTLVGGNLGEAGACSVC